VTERWMLHVYRVRRPWWGLGVVGRSVDFEAEHDGPEEVVLVLLAELKAEHPKWQFELTRGW
jgi:hypothetical protein